MDLNVSETQLCVSVEVCTVRLPPAKVQEYFYFCCLVLFTCIPLCLVSSKDLIIQPIAIAFGSVQNEKQYEWILRFNMKNEGSTHCWKCIYLYVIQTNYLCAKEHVHVFPLSPHPQGICSCCYLRYPKLRIIANPTVLSHSLLHLQMLYEKTKRSVFVFLLLWRTLEKEAANTYIH